MTNSQRFRIGVTAVAAATAYYYLLLYCVGYMTALPRPAWWMAAFPSRLFSARVWLITLHTIAVLISAAPIALLIRVLAPTHRIAVGVVAAVLVLVVANLPLRLDLLASSWQQHPVYLITDSLKVMLAVPFLTWLLSLAPFNPSLERP